MWTLPAEGFAPIRDGVAQATARHAMTLVIGGNNAITRPAAHGLGVPLDRVGLITLDAHFDLRETSDGPRNGNPVRCLLEDGLPGRNICQIGLAPFANTVKMHLDALEAGITVSTARDVRSRGIDGVVAAALDQLGHVDRILVDFDIDVIDRGQFPGAPGARPGGMTALDFFAAARRLAAEPKVAAVDLAEFDPSLDATDLSALTAARWVAEILAGYQARPAQ
jgi:formiminoglutamase